MAILTYTTTTSEDEIITWELARRAKANKTSPKDAQALFGIEVGHILRTWVGDRKSVVLAKVQTDPASVTVEDKATLGIVV